MKRKKISLIIPCYNEEKNIKLMYDKCVETFSNKKINVEIIFINDGSNDNTLEELKDLSSINKIIVKIISFSRNFGKEAAMYAGLEAAEGDYVGIIDCDLQQPPEMMLNMIEFIEQNDNYDCVCCYQYIRNENKIIAFLKSVFYKIITKISDIEFVNGASDFRLFRRYVVDAILSLKEKNRFSKGIFNWVGFNTYYMPYTPDKRVNGKSSFNFKKLFKYAMNGIISFSVAPLRIATYSGLVFAIIAFIYMIITIIEKIFFTIDVPGYATLLTCLLFIGSLILCSIGIVGEYIAKIFIEQKNRPIYIRKEYIVKDGKND